MQQRPDLARLTFQALATQMPGEFLIQEAVLSLANDYIALNTCPVSRRHALRRRTLVWNAYKRIQPRVENFWKTLRSLSSPIGPKLLFFWLLVQQKSRLGTDELATLKPKDAYEKFVVLSGFLPSYHTRCFLSVTTRARQK